MCIHTWLTSRQHVFTLHDLAQITWDSLTKLQAAAMHSILFLEHFYFICFMTLNSPCFLYTVELSATLMKFWFIMQAIRHEAFTHMEGQKEFVQIDQHDLFPYLLVNIGSGVSIIKVIMHRIDIHCILSPCLMYYVAAFLR